MSFFKYGPIKAVFALFTVLSLLPSVLSAAKRSVEENYALQAEHMAYLENEYYLDYTPLDEDAVTGFDKSAAVASGVKFNEVRFIGTHNSYQLNPTSEYTELSEALDILTFGIATASRTEFYSDYLTQQLELGIRSVELDIETVVKNGETKFVVSHEPNVDITSNCYDFAEALREIKMWSDHNPNHLPVTVIIEPKKNILPVDGMKNFTLDKAKIFDELIREVLGETLLTPADMLRDYDSFAQMRENNDWLSLEATLGKVLVLLHDTTVTKDYINTDKTIKTQAMFPMLRFSDIDKPYASFIIENKPDKAMKHNDETVKNYKLIVRTRADSFTSYSDKKYENSINCGSQIISTDYPVRAEESDNHIFDFGGGVMVCTVQ